jgi:hypothetical protein
VAARFQQKVTVQMEIRDRIKELRRVRAGDLRPNPRNWRTHPPAQQDALRGVLAEIGFASALLVRELDDGSLQIIDGHLRAETAPDAFVPVLVLDVDEAEAAKLLATFDSLTAMAETNTEALNGLLADIDIDSGPVRQMLDKLSKQAGQLRALVAPINPIEKAIPELFQIVVECEGEAQQQALFERLTQEGYVCKLLTL